MIGVASLLGYGTAAPPLGLVDRAREFLDSHRDLFYLYAENPVWHLLLVLGVFALLFLGRLRHWTRQIDAARASMPLVIGGWGTRGKSGTARKKSALLHAFGAEVFTKTTGCEAMVIHAVPERPGVELFLYRPYDKATIWEQRHVLRTAERLRPHAFLYECMALNPTYVDIIAHGWMRDDVATITNAYPDHEDIQGPRGIDLPYVIGRFIPRGTFCVTAEETMRPVLASIARSRGTRLVPIDWREAALIPEDVLARYPYRVHPMNLALVTRLGEELGIEREFAWKEIADWIVPDLGVLKVFPIGVHRGRRLEFSNGHSANERHGFNANWRRLGLDSYDPRAHPDRWIVTVINNRADRIARSKVFADAMVQDVRVHRHILIGTNLSGLTGYVRAALAARLEKVFLIDPDYRGEGEALLAHARANLDRELHRLCWEVQQPEDVLARVRAMLLGLGLEASTAEEIAGAPELVAALAASTLRAPELDPLLPEARQDPRGPAGGGEDPRLAAALEALATAARAAGIEPALAADVAHWTERWARELGTLKALRAHLEAALQAPAARTTSGRARLDGLLRAFVERAFMAKLQPLDDPLVPGDGVVDFVARRCPPGLLVQVHGAQNIKGPGLDWCYRWIALERVHAECRRLDHPAPEVRRDALAWLAGYNEYGILDAPVAIAAIERMRAEPRNQDLAVQTSANLALHHVRRCYQEALARLQTRTVARSRLARTLGTLADRLLLFIERLLDAGDSKARRRRADRILDDLAEERISHERAAALLRELVARQKGGWLKKALQKWWREWRASLER